MDKQASCEISRGKFTIDVHDAMMVDNEVWFIFNHNGLYSIDYKNKRNCIKRYCPMVRDV